MSQSASLPSITPSMSFDEASAAVTQYLGQVMPWGSWSVSRIAGDVQTHLFVDDGGFGLAVGTDVPMDETLCQHMLAGEGPRVAPDVSEHPAYVPHAVPFGISAYAGSPIHEDDGSVFGVLCGLSSEVQPAADAAQVNLLDLLAGLLGIVLAADRQRARTDRQLAVAAREAETDELTGLPNRKAWNRLVAEEADHYRRFADPTVVAIVDLDGLKQINDEQGHQAGDDLLRLAASMMSSTLPDGQLISRLGGDEFGLLLRDTTADQARSLIDHLVAVCQAAGVSLSIGMSPVLYATGFAQALARADEEMYAVKHARKAVAVAPDPAVSVPLPDVTADMGFAEAAECVLEHLRAHQAWGSWSITRIDAGHQVHLHTSDGPMPVSAGTTVPLERTYCAQMLAGAAPRIAGDVSLVPAYDAIDSQTQAYAGHPIHQVDGELFGVLCGYAPTPVAASALLETERLLALLSGLLSSVLAVDRQRHEEVRADLLQMQEDPRHTGVDAWRALVAHAADGYRKFGDVHVAIALQLTDESGGAPSRAAMAGATAVIRQALGDDALVLVLGDEQLGVLVRDGVGDPRHLIDRRLSEIGMAAELWIPPDGADTPGRHSQLV